DDKGRDARKRAYCLKIQPATGSFARNLIYSTKPGIHRYVHQRLTTSLTGNEEQGGKILFLQSREPHLGVLSAFTEMLPEHNNEQAGLCYPACCVNLVIFRQID
uniref:hypothetical protein n=1 Tax=Klebsiella sp. 10982 TaxID=1196034 RepID=UPI001D0D778A